MPKPILNGYLPKNEVEISDVSATEYILCTSCGETYFLKWWGNGWVIKYKDSYLCKNKEYKHYSDIPAFEFSFYPSNSPNPFNGNKGWEHVFDTKEEAVEFYRTKDLSRMDRFKNPKFYNKVYDILQNMGGATGDEYREAFIFEFVEDKYSTDEWRFQGKLGFGGKYRGELNSVDCYPEDETPERLALIKKINKALKELEDEKD